MRRLAMVLVSDALAAEVLMPAPATSTFEIHGEKVTVANAPFQAHRCDEGLPDGARLVAAGFDGVGRYLRLIFEHESFDPVEEGADPATLLPRFSRADPRSCCFGHPCPTCRKEA